MPVEKRTSVLLLGGALVLALCGCVSNPPQVESRSEEAFVPTFASEEEAFTAAVAAYVGYLNILTTIASEDGIGMERLDIHAAPDVSAFAKGGLVTLQQEGLRTVGQQSASKTVLQSYYPQAESGVDIISIYVCVDVSNLDLVDHAGRSVVEADRPDQTPFEASFNLIGQDPAHLVVATNTVWAGDGVC